MHELHMIKDLTEDLLKKAREVGADRVTKIYIRMGEMTEINPEILQTYFNEKVMGTIAEGAKIELENSPTRELRLVSFDCE